MYAHGLLFLSPGYDDARLLAIHPDGAGDVTDTHVVWSRTRGAPHNPSPLVVGDELYVVSDRGVASCLDARSGHPHWRRRLSGNFSASPLYAAGRIYFLNEQGTTIILRPGTNYHELARNRIAGRTLASLTPVEGALLVRSDTHLYRIAAE